jgi:hypothetical protein
MGSPKIDTLPERDNVGHAGFNVTLTGITLDRPRW